MKKILIAVIGSIFVLSCSKDDNDSVNITDDNFMKLRRENTSSIESLYEYNTSGYVSKTILKEESSSLIIESVYEYFQGNLRAIKSTITQKGIITNRTQIFEYEYGLVVKKTDIEGEELMEHYYSYDASANLEEDIFYKNGILFGKTTYVFQNGLLLEEKTYPYNSATSEYNTPAIWSYEYDTKNNPYYDLFPNAYEKVTLQSKNNWIKAKANGKLIERTFNYDSDGYPTECKYLNDSASSNSNFQYYK
jgi:hypothetical protein